MFDFLPDTSLQAKFSSIALEMEKKYPGHILPEEHRDWLFINAGGWMGSIYIFHASLTEYVMFFGTAIDTSGNSGTQLNIIIIILYQCSQHRLRKMRVKHFLDKIFKSLTLFLECFSSSSSLRYSTTNQGHVRQIKGKNLVFLKFGRTTRLPQREMKVYIKGYIVQMFVVGGSQRLSSSSYSAFY